MINELITHSLESYFLAELKKSKKVRIISPFVTKGIVSKLVAKKIRLELITRFSESDFIQGVSDLEALEELMIQGVKIKGVKDLHSKVYIFDKSAIVTSGNLTKGGFRNNYECGILTRDSKLIKDLNNYFDSFKKALVLNKNLLIKIKNNLAKISATYVKPKLPKTIDHGTIFKHAETIRKQAKTNYFFVNVGNITKGKIREERNWDDCRKFNFLSAGQGRKFSDKLKRLRHGDIVFAYVSTYGYVGVGQVVKTAVRVNEFRCKGNLLSAYKNELKGRVFKNANNVDKSEYLVEMEWLKTLELKDALSAQDKYFFYESVICTMANQMETVDWLLSSFKVSKRTLA